MNLKDVLRVSLDVCRGLCHIPNEGYFHESGNVLMRRIVNGELHGVVSDVGMWTEDGIGDDRIRCLSPEVILKDGKERTRESDLRAMGMVMREMITHEIPFHSLIHSHVSKVSSIVESLMNFHQIAPKVLKNLPD
eukprot:TRINITY_DN2759_c0_g1_i1.p1 TRINITY_DN2759_c0_g1~~TRINITY_DN2759_c0_g1_i1.p1  ORF type:complete len:135 (-),score=37.80 TRINITY_DN2759_c0_g1_i1:386-790(-)